MTAASIPVIDLTAADDGGPARTAVARALVEAAVEHGFVYIRNTGREIPIKAVDEAFAVSRKLFALPTAEKQACAIQNNNRGWLGMHVETLDPKTQRVGDTKEAFNFGEFAGGRAQQPVPAALAPDEPRIAAFYDLCYRLCLKLNDLLGIGLEVDPPDFFTAAHRREAGPSGNTLRFLYYPPRQPGDPEAVRAGAHSDYGSLTLLFRLPGQAGLEIRTRDGGWAPVPVTPRQEHDNAAPPPILVNIGDLLAYWTGGLLRSTVHRVAFGPPAPDGPANGDAVTTTTATLPGESADAPRYSIAFFCHPAGSSPLTPVPSARVAQAVAATEKNKAQDDGSHHRKVLTADEHLQMRLRATYLDLYKD
ncbi:2og-Fe oxygenase family protein [Niveomyces insectorum RCEF 264]|uniref:2og-Fe oxygenase family protein n=1 Tax=Niveomyces insectorum RCEF 264 TaxID=1081102 RepID=A0A167X7J0_9HYPO|nr:2og-Fe oxygenase family protein [Niveomyces insectorum RCEF 264]